MKKTMPVLPEKFEKLGFRVFEEGKSPDDWEPVMGARYPAFDMPAFEISLPAEKVHEIDYKQLNKYISELQRWMFGEIFVF